MSIFNGLGRREDKHQAWEDARAREAIKAKVAEARRQAAAKQRRVDAAARREAGRREATTRRRSRNNRREY